MAFIEDFSTDPDDFIEREVRRVPPQAVLSLDDNPDDAARAQRLARATGAPPSVVYGDLENFDTQVKTRLTQQLLENSPELQAYVRSSDLASKVSNDDYVTLDELAQVLKKLPIPALPAVNLKTIEAGIEGFRQGFAADKVAEGYAEFGGKLAELPVFQNVFLRHATQAAGGTVLAGLHGLTGLAAGASAMVGEKAKQFGVPEAWANRLTRDAFAAIQVAMPELGAWTPAMTSFNRAIAPYVAADKMPPVGLHPIIDEVYTEQAKVDIQNLNEALKKATESTTKERSPEELFPGFVRQVNNSEIGISVDAIRDLYGDDVPHVMDGVLGWIPDLERQLAVAEATGGDVKVPLAEWLAYVDPQVSKKLEENIRVREGGLTLKEAEGIEAWHGSPHTFEQFSSEKIGTGEGAQSYGYGHYVAEAQAVGDEYSRMRPMVQGQEFTPNNPVHVAALAVQDTGSLQAALTSLKDQLTKMSKEDSGYYKSVEAAIDLLSRGIVPPKIDAGNLYRVRILRNKDEFLDWDRPLGEQPEAVQKALVQRWALMRGVDEASAVAQLADMPSAGDIYTTMERYSTRQQVAKDFAEAGIPGIKYLDQGSRQKIQPDIVESIAEYKEMLQHEREILAKEQASIQAGAARGDVAGYVKSIKGNIKRLEDGIKILEDGTITRNYVVFSDKDLLILDRNGEAVNDIRRTSGLEPKPETTLRPTDSAGDAIAFEILQEGTPVGHLNITAQEGGRVLYIDDVGADGGPNSLGPKAMHDILTQLKELYPQAERVEGMRVSGAREQSAATSPGELRAGVDLKKVKPKQLELDVTRMEDREAFDKGAAIGMTADQYRRYQKLIEKRQAEDQAYYSKKAVEAARKRQTAEWKANEVEVRKEVVNDFKQRPDLKAEQYFREAIYDGDKVSPRPKLDAELLTPEQLAALPPEYVIKDGMHPDDAAALFGYPSGAELIADVAGLTAARKASGMRPMDFSRHLVKEETQRRMEERYGKLEENIIEEAKEHVLSETQLELLHEDALAAAMDAGLEFSIKKEDLLASIRARFDDLPLRQAKSDAFLADVGRANRAAEMALLKGDYVEAFREKQRAYIAGVNAREAVRIERLIEKFEKTVKRFASPQVKGYAQDSVNYVHALLNDAGIPLKVTPEEIKAAIEFEGTGNLADYVANKSEYGYEPLVSGRIIDEGPGKITEMTVEQFQELKDAVDSLAHIARQEQLIEIQGQKQDWAAFQDQVVDNLSQLPVRSRESQGRWLYEADAPLTRMEEIVKDVDLRGELGPMFNAVIVPMAQAKATKYDLTTNLSDAFKKMKKDFGRKWRKTLSDAIPQEFIIDPYYLTPYNLTRENLIQVMLNWGNPSNIMKFARGYATLEQRILRDNPNYRATKEEALEFANRTKELIDRHATREDWKFVEEFWARFKELQPLADTVARNVSGVAPKWIAPHPVETPFGTLDGGYWPVKYDRLGSDLQVIEDKGAEGAIFGNNYYRAATAKGHLKERTGYIDFVDINQSLEQSVGVLQQSIHDIAYREALIQAGKVFYDKKIRGAVRKHYGSEYEKQMIPWLKRIANEYAVDDAGIAWYNRALRQVRINLIGFALPLNIPVMLSADVGAVKPLVWAGFEANRGFNRALALEHSKEIRHLIYNLDRDVREHLTQIMDTKGFSAIQRKAVEWGFLPMMKLTQEFRMATFVHEFNKAKVAGRSDAEAATLADSYVRERHGSGAVQDLPSALTSNETMKMLTVFMTYFSAMRNWSRQLPGNVRRKEWGKGFETLTGSILVGAAFGALLFNKADKDDNWFQTIGKAVGLQALGGIPVIRDAANYWLEGRSPRIPAAGLINTVDAAIREGKRYYKGEATKRPISSTANLVGVATGLPTLQIGRIGQFLYDVQHRRQRPKNFMDWARGFTFGHMEGKK